jgi:hypothetical protein
MKVNKLEEELELEIIISEEDSEMIARLTKIIIRIPR